MQYEARVQKKYRKLYEARMQMQLAIQALSVHELQHDELVGASLIPPLHHAGSRGEMGGRLESLTR